MGGAGQSRWESLREAAANTGLAFLLSVLSQRYIIAPLQLWHAGCVDGSVCEPEKLVAWLPAALITLYYTLLSLGRNYIIRRWGNRRMVRGGEVR